MPAVITSLLIGALIGAVNGTSIFFDKEERHKLSVFLATIARNAFVGILTYYSLTAQTKWWNAMMSGILYGSLLGFVVLLAKGGLKNKDHLIMLPFSALTGAAIGLLLWKLYY